MGKKKRGKSGGAGGRKVRVDFRRNRQAPPRQKGIPLHVTHEVDDHDDLATPDWETVSAKGDLSRKRTVIESDNIPAGATEGFVLAVRGLIADVEVADGTPYACTIRRVLRTRRIEERHPVVVGDRVLFIPSRVTGEAVAEGVIVRVLARRSQLRRATERRTHLIAANVDQVIVVASVDLPPLKPSLIDRYLVSASAGGMDAVVCLNKADLDVDGRAAAVLERYARIGYPTLMTSVATSTGVDALRERLRGKSSVFAGQSGVGKSSLLNAVQPEWDLRIGEVCMVTEKGRHTTTTARLLKLNGGGYVVDTPGIRAFELAMIPVSELEAHFVEFADRVADCKFANCTHIHEEDCAIRTAVARGEIHPERHATYVRLFKERCGLVPKEDYGDEADSRR